MGQSQLDRIEEKIDRIERWINGDNGTPGVKVRIDRVEGWISGIKGRERWIMGVVASAVAIALGTLAKVLWG